jgi:hypothetical protein
MIRRFALGALFLSLAWTTLPGLVRAARANRQDAAQIELRRLARSIRPGETVALLPRQAVDAPAVAFFNYYAYPQHTRLFYDLRSYRETSGRPRRIIRFDLERSPHPRELTYEEVRAEVIGDDRVSSLQPPALTVTGGIVPTVASVGGPWPDDFRTEAVVVNASPSPVRVTFELLPRRQKVDVLLRPHQEMKWNDFVYEVFDRRDQGWMRFNCDGPVRARFWFVDRGRRQALEVPLSAPATRVHFNAPPEAKLWFLNPNERPIAIMVNDARHQVPALSWGTIRVTGSHLLTSEDPFVAYISWRDGEGKTRVVW